MAWFKKSKAPIAPVEAKKVQMPEGIWTKCKNCNEIIYTKEIERNLNVCPKCDYHFRISARERIELVIDAGTFVEMDPESAKAAIEGLTRSLARELGRDNIRVNTIIPGNVQTPRQMKWYSPEGEAEIVAAQCLDGRIQPVDIAAMALFLASDESSFVSGQSLAVDGGFTAGVRFGVAKMMGLED